jgi:hypothetical protein
VNRSRAGSGGRKSDVAFTADEHSLGHAPWSSTLANHNDYIPGGATELSRIITVLAILNKINRWMSDC